MILFAAVILLAIFLRLWHFQDWLFFKMDQARDALLIKQALENGPGWLPLLGPKAGGTQLNLGPIFYYFQYFASILFQSAHPAVMAFPDLLFSILSIPLFYLFIKKYFSRDWSMVLAGLYALCFLGIEYSRFSWNPNSLVFFNLLYFYALLNVFDENIKHKLRWVIIAGLSFAISTQLHFLSFATLPIITAAFLISNRKDIRKFLDWKRILIFLGLVLLVYLPVIANEIISHGKNTGEFFEAVKEKPSSHSFWQNIKRDIRYWGQNWFLILTGWISKKTGLKSAILAWLGVMLPGLWFGAKNYRSEKNGLKKKFLLLAMLWFIAYFLVYIPIAYQIRPRFFLPLLALPFIFVGFVADYFWSMGRKIGKVAVVGGLGIIIAGNLYGTHQWFKEISASQNKGVYPKRTIILKARDGIVWWHLEKAADYISQDCDNSTVLINTSSEYKNPMKYALALKNLTALSLDKYDGEQAGCFYATGLTRSKKLSLKNKDKYEILSQQKFGAFSVYKLNPKSDETFATKGEKEESEKRIFWKDVF